MNAPPHPSPSTAHAPIDDLVAAVGPVGMRVDTLDEATAAALKAHLRALDQTDRIELLKAAVAWMPQYRGPDRVAGRDTTGPLLYATACRLYRTKLPLTEGDLCELLRLARHECGHGGDTRAPFDLAREHQRRHGYSPALAAAIRDFTDSLPPARTTAVRELRRSADLLAVLDPTTPITGSASSRTPWIESVRRSLTELDEPELAVWRRLVLAMAVTERMTVSAKWATVAQGAIDELGGQRVLQRLQVWWPRSDEPVSLERSGLPLMKHLIWLLGLMPHETADALIASIARMSWYPQRREPLGVLKPAIAHLSANPSPQTAEALGVLEQRLAAAVSALQR